MQVLFWDCKSGTMQRSNMPQRDGALSALKLMQSQQGLWSVISTSTGELSWCSLAAQ